MLPLILIGLTLVTACEPPTIDGPVTTCVVSLTRGQFNCGPRILDYKTEREKVGEWQNIELNVIGSIEEIPQKELVCVTTEDWLTKIKPTLKKGHDFWVDYNNGNK